MSQASHTHEQGIRVHYLANLGGLMAVAGLDHHPPDFLLGVLLEVSACVPRLSAERWAELCARGQARLEERAAEKRAWNAWRHARQLHRLDLSTAELRRLLAALAEPEAATTIDPAARLLRVLRKPADA